MSSYCGSLGESCPTVEQIGISSERRIARGSLGHGYSHGVERGRGGRGKVFHSAVVWWRERRMGPAAGVDANSAACIGGKAWNPQPAVVPPYNSSPVSVRSRVAECPYDGMSCAVIMEWALQRRSCRSCSRLFSSSAPASFRSLEAVDWGCRLDSKSHSFTVCSPRSIYLWQCDFRWQIIVLCTVPLVSAEKRDVLPFFGHRWRDPCRIAAALWQLFLAYPPHHPLPIRLDNDSTSRPYAHHEAASGAAGRNAVTNGSRNSRERFTVWNGRWSPKSKREECTARGERSYGQLSTAIAGHAHQTAAHGGAWQSPRPLHVGPCA